MILMRSIQHQGKYPVLYINFSDFPTKCEDFENFKKVFSRTISGSYVCSSIKKKSI